jgi:hypothetical protein
MEETEKSGFEEKNEVGRYLHKQHEQRTKTGKRRKNFRQTQRNNFNVKMKKNRNHF